MAVIDGDPSAAGSPQTQDPVRTFLARELGLTAGELARVDAGHVIARTLDVSDRREVATLGIVRLKISPEFYVAQFDDIARFKRDGAVLQIGTFGNPPHIRDVAGLSLDDSDLRSLRKCHVGNCDVQLPAAVISRYRREVDWGRADAPEQANGVIRQMLVDYVAEYQRTGVAASMEYADRRNGVNLRREFTSLADGRLGPWGHFERLRRHLTEYTGGDSPETVDLLYWSKEKIGRRGVASVTHLAIAATAGESPAAYAVGSKHLYGTHYFDASLGLTMLFRDGSAGSPATYLAYLNQSRVDVFGGMLGGVTRTVVSGRARATVSGQLTRLQQTLEREFERLRTLTAE